MTTHGNVSAQDLVREAAPGCIVDSSAKIGKGTQFGPNVVVRAGSQIGEDVRLAAGTYIGEGASIASGATLGPNSVVMADRRIGPHAELTAGSVATEDVPPYAIAEGNPAQIVGYHSSPAYAADLRLRASTIAHESAPLPLGRSTLHMLPRVDDLRGSLVFGEIDAHLPFTPVRYFTVFGVPGREVRGEHCHKELHELIICVNGECTVMVNDGTERAEIVLDTPTAALHLRPMTWTAQYHYSPDAVLLVLCSHVYEADDYIRTYAEFERLLAESAPHNG